MAKTLKCYECKQSFLKEQLVSYSSPRAQVLHNYCPNCLKEKQLRDNFSEKVCYIFGIKAPGPRIWTERKRLINTYGYTDQTIIDCLEYIYNVEKKRKITESLCLVNPISVEKMMKYKKQQQVESMTLARAFEIEVNEYVVPIKENHNKVNDNNFDPDEWLED